MRSCMFDFWKDRGVQRTLAIVALFGLVGILLAHG